MMHLVLVAVMFLAIVQPASTQSDGDEEAPLPGKTEIVGSLPSELEVKVAPTGHLLVKPKLNGEDVGWFIFDTGAGMSCIDKAIAERLKLPDMGSTVASGSGGKQATRFVRADTFNLGALHLEKAPLVELDLRGIRMFVDKDLAGIIGFECFPQTVYEVDAAKGTIRLLPADFEPKDASWSPLTIKGRRPYVEGKIEDNEAGLLLLDTGANDACVVHPGAVEKFKLLENRKTRGAMFGGVGGMKKAAHGVIKSLHFAGASAEDIDGTFSQASEGAMATDTAQATIGMQLLKRYILIVDYAHSRIALRNQPAQK